jgi:hypothetical protein
VSAYHPDGRLIRSDRGQRPRVRCACDRQDMDYKAARCRQCHNERRRKYWREFKALPPPRVDDFPEHIIEARYQRAKLEKRVRRAA